VKRRWLKNNYAEWRRRVRGKDLEKQYGITFDEYNALRAAQAYRCAICGREEANDRSQLAVDHDHETGIVRGLLCIRCNTHLGWYEKLTEPVCEYLLRSLLKYAVIQEEETYDTRLEKKDG